MVRYLYVDTEKRKIDVISKTELFNMRSVKEWQYEHADDVEEHEMVQRARERGVRLNG